MTSLELLMYPRRTKYEPELRVKAVKLYLSGLSAIEVEKKLGCTSASVSRWCRLVGGSRSLGEAAKLRKRKYDNEIKEEAVSLYESGLSSTQVEEMLGCCARMVYAWVKEKGISRSISEALKIRGITPPSQKGVKRSLETRLKISGERNHFWRGGVAPLRKRIRMSMKTREWRKAVFDRDNYTCQNCGLRSMAGARLTLNAHHKVPFVELLRKFKIDTFEKAMACKELWELENGVTLCVDCH